MKHGKRIEIALVVYDGVQALGLTGPAEVFATAARSGAGAPRYRTRTASVGGEPVRTSSGLTMVPDGGLGDGPVPDLLIVPGSEDIPEAGEDVVAAVGDLASRTPRVAALCTGVFLLAETGALAGHRVTTHWKWCARLARDHPDVRVDQAATFVRDGRVATAGGGTSGIDLALALVEKDAGRDSALRVSRHLVTHLRRPGDQLQFAQYAGPDVEHPAVRRALALIAQDIGGDLSLERLAAHAGVSVRHFTRLFTSQVGMSPRRHVERVRVEAARRLLERPAPRACLDEVSAGTGFGTPEAMRVSFHRVLHVEPGEYQERFGTCQDPRAPGDRRPAPDPDRAVTPGRYCP